MYTYRASLATHSSNDIRGQIPVRRLSGGHYGILRQINHMIRNRQRGRCGGARGIQDVQGPGLPDKIEILHQFTGRRKSLRPDASPSLDQIIDLEIRDQALERTAKECFAQRSPKLVPAHPWVTKEEPPETRVGESLDHIAQYNVTFTVSFPRQCQHRIRSSLDPPMNHPSKVHSQEWKTWVGHWIDQVSDQMLAVLSKLEVFPPKRHDLGCIAIPGHPAYPVTMKSSAIDKVIGFVFARGSLNLPAIFVFKSDNFRRELNLSSARNDFFSQDAGNRGKVNNAFLWNENPRQAGSMRFNGTNLFRTEKLKPFEPVCDPALKECMETREFLLFGGDYDLSALFKGDIVLRAEFDHPANALDGESSLCRARLIVEAAVKNTAVVSGLMTAGATFFLEKEQVYRRESSKELICRCETDNSTTHDRDLFDHNLNTALHELNQDPHDSTDAEARSAARLASGLKHFLVGR